MILGLVRMVLHVALGSSERQALETFLRLPDLLLDPFNLLDSRKAGVVTRYVDVLQMPHKVRLRYHRIVRLLSQNMLLGLIPLP
jgi:hypothetical protein